jgi:hypothetical protein
VTPETTRLCNLLAERVETFQGKRPAIPSRWHKDFRLLLERGPLKRAEPEPLTVEKVEATIAAVFTDLAEPDTKGFCWAAQIRSPHALRDHWDQLATAWRLKHEGGNAAPPARRPNSQAQARATLAERARGTANG